MVESMMDTELKSIVESKLNEFDEQALLEAYMVAHKEKYGKDFLQS